MQQDHDASTGNAGNTPASDGKGAGGAPQFRPSPDFFVRMNDILALANRIGRRAGSQEANMTLMHAFARYAAHNYRSHAKADQDDEQARVNYVTFLGNRLAHAIMYNIKEMNGENVDAPPATSTGEPDAG